MDIISVSSYGFNSVGCFLNNKLNMSYENTPSYWKRNKKKDRSWIWQWAIVVALIVGIQLLFVSVI